MSTIKYDDWNAFGKRVNITRSGLGITVEKLAEDIGRSENFIFKIESGNGCSIDTLVQLCDKLHISSDYLLFGDNMKNEVKNHSDRKIIDNLLNTCNDKQLKVIKEVLTAICLNFEDLEHK